MADAGILDTSVVIDLSDIESARSYGRVYALVRTARRQPRSRVADLMIASIAAAPSAALCTPNPADWAGLDSMITVTAI